MQTFIITEIVEAGFGAWKCVETMYGWADTHEEAVAKTTKLARRFTFVDDSLTVECVERETNSNPTIVRVINPRSGYEYFAYFIREVNF